MRSLRPKFGLDLLGSVMHVLMLVDERNAIAFESLLINSSFERLHVYLLYLRRSKGYVAA